VLPPVVSVVPLLAVVVDRIVVAVLSLLGGSSPPQAALSKHNPNVIM
jgi:hypothetical protein